MDLSIFTSIYFPTRTSLMFLKPREFRDFWTVFPWGSSTPSLSVMYMRAIMFHSSPGADIFYAPASWLGREGLRFTSAKVIKDVSSHRSVLIPSHMILLFSLSLF